MTTSTIAPGTGRVRKPWYGDLTFQVLVGMALGVAVGALAPDIGRTLNPLGDIFIHLIQMVVGLIIFCTVTHGSPACAIWARSDASRSRPSSTSRSSPPSR
jgi:aerobic C4-dicarboxylate transport protein